MPTSYPTKICWIRDFEILLEDANKKSMTQKCAELLMFEVYKYSNGVSPDIMNTVLKLRQNATWKISTQFKSSKQKKFTLT